MSSRFNRFLHIEHPRGEKESADGPVSLRDGGRFESPGEAGALPSPAVPEAHLERFKQQGQTPLVMDDGPPSGQHFSRCIRCETENGRFAVVCTTCGADLRAPEQRAEDEKRGRERARAEEREREEMRVRQTMPAERPTWHTEEEEEGIPPVFEPSLGVGLLRRIQNPTARWLSVGGAVGLPLLLTRAGHGPLWALGMYLGVFVAASFVPSAFWMMRRRDE
ncbi:hypothetical protein CYFUS_009658 [Cystobacter fuscus]|uniref:Uncharacterized protein n=1 Tax=Cystobacter fuscus TaxID=43 RepID=A0A250JM49_9BACT|nr:hypothetical protein [Cystobacter fuscus]ATB44176.1 hypothetical protein CYFUS_009658 [Cystobacter fuscus]